MGVTVINVKIVQCTIFCWNPWSTNWIERVWNRGAANFGTYTHCCIMLPCHRWQHQQPCTVRGGAFCLLKHGWAHVVHPQFTQTNYPHTSVCDAHSLALFLSIFSNSQDCAFSRHALEKQAAIEGFFEFLFISVYIIFAQYFNKRRQECMTLWQAVCLLLQLFLEWRMKTNNFAVSNCENKHFTWVFFVYHGP